LKKRRLSASVMSACAPLDVARGDRRAVDLVPEHAAVLLDEVGIASRGFEDQLDRGRLVLHLEQGGGAPAVIGAGASNR